KNSGITYSYKKTESYSGPDGAYSKSEEGEGKLDGSGFSSSSTKTNATMDDKGFNMSSETKERGMDAASTLGTLGKMGSAAKRAKTAKAKKEAMDGRDLVVEEVQLAEVAAEAPVEKAAPETPVEAPAPVETPVAETPVETPVETPAETPKAETGTSAPVEAAEPAAEAPAAKAVPADLVGKPAISEVVFAEGFAFYISADPIQEYDVIFEISTGMSASMLTVKAEGFFPTMERLAADARNKRQKKKYQDARVDAIITTGGAEARAVQFRTDPEMRYAKVHSVLGVEIYMASEPLRKYEILRNVTNSTPMVGKPNIQARAERMIKKFRKENPSTEFDAVISKEGKDYLFVKFE
ncbi:MAG: hypothetical protein AAF570_18035, partial [Bacteroidota bacterium]